MNIYIIGTFVFLYLIMQVYFKIADRYNIIDKPNDRSSHTQITLRGGGIVFSISLLWCFGYFYSQYPARDLYFLAGLLLIAALSFWDDVRSLSSKVRLLLHLVAVSLLLYSLDFYVHFPLWAIPILYIVVIGIINAYNFMDGINGITGLYSLVAVVSLYIAYHQQDLFSQYKYQSIFQTLIIACLVFLFFNFRKRAKCFAGDVGSVSLGFILIWLLARLMADTQSLKYILFLSVYGVDAVLTIIHRLVLKQNIMEAHRMHLYQNMANERKIPHLGVSACYGAVQLGINIFAIYSPFSLWINAAIVLLPLVAIYLWGKKLWIKM